MDTPRRLAISMSAYKQRWRRPPPPEGTYVFRCDASDEVYSGYFVEGRRRAIDWGRRQGAIFLNVRPSSRAALSGRLAIQVASNSFVLVEHFLKRRQSVQADIGCDFERPPISKTLMSPAGRIIP